MVQLLTRAGLTADLIQGPLAGGAPLVQQRLDADVEITHKFVLPPGFPFSHQQGEVESTVAIDSADSRQLGHGVGAAACGAPGSGGAGFDGAALARTAAGSGGHGLAGLTPVFARPTAVLHLIEVLQLRLTGLDDHAAEETAGLLSREGLDQAQAGLGDGGAAEDVQPVLQVDLGQGWLSRGASPRGLSRRHFFSWKTPT